MSKLLRFAYAAVAITDTLAISSGCKNLSTKSAGSNTENSQTPRGSATPDKSGDEELKALIEQTVPKFSQLEFNDPETGKTMLYNLLSPKITTAAQNIR